MTTVDQDRKAKAILNERTKLAATYLNGLAVAIFVVVGVAPVFTAGLTASMGTFGEEALVTLALAGVASVALHAAAQILLRRIEP